MKKTYKMQDLECANCAAKMENAIKKLDGVENASVSFMMQRLTLEADETKLDDILKEASKICKKIERNCKIIY